MTSHFPYSIRDLSEEFGVTPRTLRFYEDRGLLHPQRKGQTRVYGARERERLSLILRGKRVGFSLDEIRDMLDLYDEPEGPKSQLLVSLNKFRTRIKSLKQQRRDIHAAIQELEDGCATIERLLKEKAERRKSEAKLVSSAAGFAGPIKAMVTDDDHI